MDHLVDSFLGREPSDKQKERWVPIIDEVETDNEILVKAEYNKGVLEVHLPKKPEMKPKQIPVNAK